MSNVQYETNGSNNMPLPYVESIDISNQNTNQSCGLKSFFISYLELQLANLDLWDSQSNSTYIFRYIETVHKGLKNIKFSLYYIANFIRNRSLKNNREKDISSLTGFGQVTLLLILSIYKGGWDTLKIDDNVTYFCQKIS